MWYLCTFWQLLVCINRTYVDHIRLCQPVLTVVLVCIYRTRLIDVSVYSIITLCDSLCLCLSVSVCLSVCLPVCLFLSPLHLPPAVWYCQRKEWSLQRLAPVRIYLWMLYPLSGILPFWFVHPHFWKLFFSWVLLNHKVACIITVNQTSLAVQQYVNICEYLQNELPLTSFKWAKSKQSCINQL